MFLKLISVATLDSFFTDYIILHLMQMTNDKEFKDWFNMSVSFQGWALSSFQNEFLFN